MTTSTALPAARKKRTIEEVEEERDQVASILRDVKRPRLDPDRENKDDFAPFELGENPETFTPDEVGQLFDVFMSNIEPKEGLQLSGEDQNLFGQQMQLISEWTAVDVGAEQTSTIAEEHGPKMPDSTGVEKLENDEGLREEPHVQFPKVSSSNRKNHFLSDRRPTPPPFFGQRTVTEGVNPPVKSLVKDGVSLADVSLPVYQVPQATQVDPRSILRRQISEELSEQERLLRDNLLAHAVWVRKTPEERIQREREGWIRQARSYEKYSVEKLGADMSGIDFRSTRKQDMLARQEELIRRVFIRRLLLSANASPSDARTYRAQLDMAVLKQQLAVLKNWRNTLCRMRARIRGYDGGFPIQPPAQVQNKLAQGGYQQSLVNAQYQAPLPVNIRTSRPTQSRGTFELVNAGLVFPAAVTGPTASTAVPPKKRRGAPRKVMFPFAPLRDTPLSATARVNENEVLRDFPEHLSLPEVMRRFVRPHGAHSGGWETKDMVEGLLRHWNQKDQLGISNAARRANLSAWVVKERDFTNSRIRKELGIPKTTRKKTLSLAGQRHQRSATETTLQPTTLQIVPRPQYSHPATQFTQKFIPASPNQQNQYSTTRFPAVAAYQGCGENMTNPSLTTSNSAARQENVTQMPSGDRL